VTGDDRTMLLSKGDLVEILQMIADERRRMADLVDSLTSEQLRTQSLCAEWTIHDVAAHVLTPLVTPRRALILALIRARFNLDRANVKLAAVVASRTAAEIATGLRENADHRFRPPILGYRAQLTDLLVHGQDIRRPLGISYRPRTEHLCVSLTFLASGKAMGFVPKDTLTGIRYEATDMPWSAGTGPTARGPGEAILMTVTGRSVALDGLHGDGVDVLRGRLADGNHRRFRPPGW
jgi:uncharacterized protein (TIGR03083 family)